MICTLCGGPVGYLGQLGNRIHYQCRNCGMGSSKLAKQKTPKLNKTRKKLVAAACAATEVFTDDELEEASRDKAV